MCKVTNVSCLCLFDVSAIVLCVSVILSRSTIRLCLLCNGFNVCLFGLVLCVSCCAADFFCATDFAIVY